MCRQERAKYQGLDRTLEVEPNRKLLKCQGVEYMKVLDGNG